MEFTYHELRVKTLSQLRSIAKGIEHDAVKGYTQMNKLHLLESICKALKIDLHEHHQVIGVNKTLIKTRIRALKKKRGDAIESQDHKQLKLIRRNIHRMKRTLHKSTL